MTWVPLVLFYGLAKGAREICKKKAMQRSGMMEVLFLYTLVSFLLVTPDVRRAGGVAPQLLAWIAVKSLVIFAAWICSFRAIAHLPISLCGVLDLSRVLFSTALGLIFLRETLSAAQLVGLTLVCGGLLLLRCRKAPAVPAAPGDAGTWAYVLLSLISCLLNAVSGTMDKVLMRSVTSAQLQFWYMLFLTALYGGYVLIRRIRIDWRNVWKNYWILLLSVLFVAADRALFIANGMPDSRVTVMTLIKQSGTLVTILGGRFVFRESDTGYKLFCALVIYAGIVIAVI